MTAQELAAQMLERQADTFEELARGSRETARLIREAAKFPAGENIVPIKGGSR